MPSTPNPNSQGGWGDTRSGNGLNFGGDQAKIISDWLAAQPDGPTSDIGPADRNNFNLPGAEERGKDLLALADQYGNRHAGQAVGSTAAGAQANDSAFRQYQTSALDRLGRLANGEDSLAQAQLQRATNANIAQQRSLAASASPGNSAAMARLAAQNIGNMGADFGSRAAELGIQERNAATNALGMLASQARGQDQSLNQFNAGARQQNNQFNAGQQQQNSQFNVGAGLQQTGLNDRAAADAREQELRNAGMMQTGSMGYEQNQTTRYGIDKGVPVQPSNWERVAGVVAGLAPLLVKSDERSKRDIQPADREMDRLIDRLKAKSFSYKDPRDGKGERFGVLAQDVERGGLLGKALVSEQQGTKVLDVPKSIGATFGLIGRLGERLDALEDRPAPRMMAEGGIVFEPTNAIIGEAGPEAVVPLDSLERLRLLGQMQPPLNEYGLDAEQAERFKVRGPAGRDMGALLGSRVGGKPRTEERDEGKDGPGGVDPRAGRAEEARG